MGFRTVAAAVCTGSKSKTSAPTGMGVQSGRSRPDETGAEEKRLATCKAYKDEHGRVVSFRCLRKRRPDSARPDEHYILKLGMYLSTQFDYLHGLRDRTFGIIIDSTHGLKVG